MNLTHIPEPELEFCNGTHVDVRFGLMNYGPLDRDDPSPARNIRLGVVGTAESADGVAQWIQKCKGGLAAKASRQPHLFPRFPGLGEATPLASDPVIDARGVRAIRSADIEGLRRITDHDRLVEEAVGIMLSEMRYVAKDTPAEVLVCAVPRQLLDVLDHTDVEVVAESDENGGGGGSSKLNFRSLLKARAMELGKPIQIVLPPTYGGRRSKRRRSEKRQPRTLQDEATRAWNFFVALYYKRGGIPWRLPRDSAALTSCFVGIAFYESLDEQRVETSVAQVFNERGEGFVVKGGAAILDKDDRTPHLSETDAHQILADALLLYRTEHKTFPARLVVHKSSRFSTDEVAGCMAAAQGLGIDQVDLVACRRSFARLLRVGAYPPLRGTFWSLDEMRHVLYTRGSVDFFETYPGLYIPLPLELELVRVEQSAAFLAHETLGLTKMNWNSTQFDHAEPITLEAARRVGSILRHLAPEDPVQPRYSFYM